MAIFDTFSHIKHLNQAWPNAVSIKSASTQVFQAVICQNGLLLFGEFYEPDFTLCDLLLIWKTRPK